MGKKCLRENPVVNSKGIFMGSVIKELSKKIKLNITAVYTIEQTKKNCKMLR